MKISHEFSSQWSVGESILKSKDGCGSGRDGASGRAHWPWAWTGSTHAKTACIGSGCAELKFQKRGPWTHVLVSKPNSTKFSVLCQVGSGRVVHCRAFFKTMQSDPRLTTSFPYRFVPRTVPTFIFSLYTCLRVKKSTRVLEVKWRVRLR